MNRSKATFWQSLREAFQVFWGAADGYAKRRLILAFAFVMLGAC